MIEGRAIVAPINSNLIKACFVILILLASVQTISATFIISVASDGVIVIGSDGVMTRRDGETGKVIGKQPSCKIRQVRNQLVAHAGMVMGSGFDFWQTVDSIAAQNTTEFVSELRDKLVETLREVAEARRKRKPNAPNYQHARVEIYVVGWEPEPVFFELVGSINSEGTPTVKSVRHWPMWDEGEGPGRTRGIYINNYLGTYDASILRERGGVYLGPVEEARAIIQAQLDAGNEAVGPPMTLVRIGKRGPEWIERGNCE